MAFSIVHWLILLSLILLPVLGIIVAIKIWGKNGK
jgi:hypothetical protein